MKNYTIRKYQSSDALQWNAFVDKAKNATFLFHRDFMEYHSDRFIDHSLLVFDAQKLVAILPANQVGSELISHQGLSYGGLVYPDKTRFETVLSIFEHLLAYLESQNIQTLHLKPIPGIYCNHFCDETAWMLFTLNAKLSRRDCLTVIDLKRPFVYSENKMRNIKKAASMGFEVREETDFGPFWNEILIPNLNARHHVDPVHSLEEIELLQTRFPNNIRQFNVYQKGRIVGGVTIFESRYVAHCQYISGDAQINKMGSLDLLFDHLLQHTFKDKDYFDFGISNENQGRHVNAGLLHWKESFGAGIAVQDFYEVETTNFKLLSAVLL
ncbi:GNAT family N-acetyltransferase [Flavobacterium sp.]|uniref:GNAT family N-acetyltransferase n=1 Tax=Flavobacterium sp. TaxID=239 RepID=UPI0039E4C14A